MTENDHTFLKEICLNVLSADKNVLFVAVVNNNGKLLAGEFNKYNIFKSSNTLIKSSTFYLHYLIPAIRQQEEEEEEEDYSHNTIHNINNTTQSNLVDLGNTVYLAVIALTEKKDRYICIYLKTKPGTTSITSSSQEVKVV